MTPIDALAVPVQAASVLAAALFWPSLEAVVAGGAPRFAGTWQSWRRLWHKQAVLPVNASWLFRAGPAAAFAAAFAAAMLVPVLADPFGGLADAPLILALVAFAGAARALAALDAGTSPPGVVAARGWGSAAAAVPALVVGIAALGEFAGGTSIGTLMRPARPVPIAPLALLLAASLLLAGGSAADTDRVERLAVDQGGRELALLLLAAKLCRLSILGLIGDVLLPFHLAGWPGSLATWAVKVVALQALLSLSPRGPSPARAAGLATLFAVAASWMLLGQVAE